MLPRTCGQLAIVRRQLGASGNACAACHVEWPNRSMSAGSIFRKWRVGWYAT